MTDEQAKNSQEAPDAVKPLESVAKGYKYYLDYLKAGGSSAISTTFGKANDILPEEMKIKPPSRVATPRTNSNVPSQSPRSKSSAERPEHTDQKSAGAKASEAIPLEKKPGSVIGDRIAEQQYIELGALKTAFDVLKLDWAKLKTQSNDPLELAEQFDQCVRELNTKYHQQGFLKERFRIVGFSNSGGSGRLLISEQGSEFIFSTDPGTGAITAQHKAQLQFPRVRLDPV
jgi:hypothetical protein